MEEENDWGGGGACGAVEDVGAGGEGEVVYFDEGAGHGGFFFVGWVAWLPWGMKVQLEVEYVHWGDIGYLFIFAPPP